MKLLLDVPEAVWDALKSQYGADNDVRGILCRDFGAYILGIAGNVAQQQYDSEVNAESPDKDKVFSLSIARKSIAKAQILLSVSPEKK